MIEIRTASGVSLDLAPDAEFEIEMNNPFLESERIPVAFSTSITFPPSATNRAVFGYFPAMLLPPTVTKVSVTILSSYFTLLIGTLEYDSVDEKGNLVYTFTEKAVDDGLDVKLHDLDLPDSRTDNMTADQLAERIRSGSESGVGAPVLYDPDGAVTQFHNMPYADEHSRFTPCVSLERLFSDAAALRMLGSISSVWEVVSVLGLYKPFTGNIKGYGDYLSIAETLPDVTLLDLLKVFCKMTCSAVFASGGTYTVVPFASLASLTPVDWNGKISDGHTFSTEKATGYGFGYQQEEVGKDNLPEEQITVVSTLKGVLDAGTTVGHVPVKYSVTGDVFSTDPVIILDENREIKTCEILYFVNDDHDAEIDGDKQDNHLSATLIRNVPAYFQDDVQGSESGEGPLRGDRAVPPRTSGYKMAGQVSFPADGGERDSKVIVGVYLDGQLLGKGVYMNAAGYDMIPVTSLAADTLYSSYHQAFEAWLAKNRQVISVDVNLSLQDIASFRMWQVVTVRNRLFLVKRLTLGLSVRLGRILCSAELISL